MYIFINQFQTDFDVTCSLFYGDVLSFFLDLRKTPASESRNHRPPGRARHSKTTTGTNSGRPHAGFETQVRQIFHGVL